MPTATLTLGDKVDTLNAEYKSRLESVLSDKKLTDEGKRRRAAEIWADTADRIAELRQGNDAALEAQKRRLQDHYLGPPKLSAVVDVNTQLASVASYRDAYDRAERAEGPALGHLIDRAHKIGDPHQVRAGLAVAYERNDIDAINRHLEHKPEDEPDLQHLIDLSAASKLEATMRAEFHLAGPTPPLGLTPSDARRLLETDGDD